MSSAERQRTIALLRSLWDKRQIPHIPDIDPVRPKQSIQGMSDEALVEQVQFWNFKDRHWVDFEADDSEQPHFEDSRANGRNTGGGRLTIRQRRGKCRTAG